MPSPQLQVVTRSGTSRAPASVTTAENERSSPSNPVAGPEGVVIGVALVMTELPLDVAEPPSPSVAVRTTLYVPSSP